jgi:flagellar basal body rod protein FlgC
MSSVTATALSGMNAATQRFADAAGRIASGKSDDQAKDIVDVLEARRDFEANLLVLRVESEMMDRLLDMKV